MNFSPYQTPTSPKVPQLHIGNGAHVWGFDSSLWGEYGHKWRKSVGATPFGADVFKSYWYCHLHTGHPHYLTEVFHYKPPETSTIIWVANRFHFHCQWNWGYTHTTTKKANFVCKLHMLWWFGKYKLCLYLPLVPFDYSWIHVHMALYYFGSCNGWFKGLRPTRLQFNPALKVQEIH